MYVNVILPLPLPGTFTYSVPPEMENAIERGARVFVQFGPKKYYTAIVDEIHYRKPESFEPKPIMMVMDSLPIVKYPQLKFWEWVAEYYLSSVGEVFKAAVPAGLKVESETFVSYNRDFEAEEGFRLTERQAMVVQCVEHEERVRISEIELKTGLKNVGATVSSLLEKGIVEIDEKSVEKYKAKKITFVRLTIPRGDHDGLHTFFDKVTRSRQQEKLLIAYLDKSRWMVPNAELLPVEKSTLMDAVKCSPGILKAMTDKGIFEIYKEEVNRFQDTSSEKSEIHLSPLSSVQEKALQEIKDSFRDKQITLLHGVTGSGKTEIYTHLIASALNQGSQVLYLVPEIALTTQLTDRLRKVFGNRILVYHSKFSDNERVDIYKRLLSTHEPMLILGVRSSVFLPFSRLGLIVVDEEHEPSYKQYDPSPRYNARDAAMVLATMHGAKTLLGSATPAIETYYKAKNGKFGLVTLKERYSQIQLPDVEIIDMRDQRKRKLSTGILSAPLKVATTHTLADKKQAIFFQNRRGFAPMVVCKECGWTPKCTNCDVSMVYHKQIGQLRCHYCGSAIDLPHICPACGLPGIETFGYGTERVAEILHQEYPEARVVRMDLDTTRNRNAYQEIIEEFAKGDTDILVGTQMISKGLDFQNVKMVGVVNADTILNFPDFRSAERGFNMISQVAGRAGRHGEKGTVYIQATEADNEILEFVKAHDYEGFYNHEIMEREKYGYPPFTRIINIILRHKDRQVVDSLAVEYTKALIRVFGTKRVLGPERPFVGRISNYHIQQTMLKVEANVSMKKVKTILRQLFEQLHASPGAKSLLMHYDVDPM